MKKAILYTGGVLNFMLAVFHMFFWQLLNWKEELPEMSKENSGILQMANVILIFILLYFAFMSFIMAAKEKSDFYAKSIIALIAGFYLIRLVLGYPFFGWSPVELGVWIFCIVMITGYIVLLRLISVSG